MLYLTENDRIISQKCYCNFLQSLKNDLQSNWANDSLICYAIIVELLKKGRFSFNGKMMYSTLFDYIYLPNMPEGVQVMYGVGCCRHVNLLLNDIMKELGFNVTPLYVRIDETDTWHRSTPSTANHLVIILKNSTDEYLLDAYNNLAFRIVGSDLEPVEIKCMDETLLNKYPDNNIREIGLVLKKYYKLQSLNINHIYDYKY